MNQDQYCIPKGIAEISAIIKDLKDAWWRMTADYQKLCQGVTPIEAAVPDVIFFLKQVNTSLDTWCAATDLVIASFLYACL